MSRTRDHPAWPERPAHPVVQAAGGEPRRGGTALRLLLRSPFGGTGNRRGRCRRDRRGGRGGFRHRLFHDRRGLASGLGGGTGDGFNPLPLRFLGGQACGLGLFLLAALFFLGLTLQVFLGLATRFLGRGEDRNLLLLTPFRFTPLGVPLLLQQRPLARRQLGRRQRSAAGAALPVGWSWSARLGRAAPATTTTAATAGWRGGGLARRGRALLAHFDLYDLGSAVAEALPDGACVDGTADFQSSRGT